MAILTIEALTKPEELPRFPDHPTGFAKFLRPGPSLSAPPRAGHSLEPRISQLPAPPTAAWPRRPTWRVTAPGNAARATAGPTAQHAAVRGHRPGDFRQEAHGLRDRLASIKLQLDVVDRSHDETAELAEKVLNFRKLLVINGLPPSTPRSAVSSKSCFF